MKPNRVSSTYYSKNKLTDWDFYYKKTPTIASITRKISQRKIIKLIISLGVEKNHNFLEIGGANSCFIAGLIERFEPKSYCIIDSNEFGLSLVDKKYPKSKIVKTYLGNILEIEKNKFENLFDFVYSVGLIEHFDQERTSRCIRAHFELCRPGGFVLMTFPTPTLIYRCIRRIAELSGAWRFFDERPLEFSEVCEQAEQYGSIVHRSTNWLIGLTQGYVAVKRNG
jgi:cyclopropane fatty-acyl-phospholipid synthase-like methyltransferase